jgi:D-amino peptidase
MGGNRYDETLRQRRHGGYLTREAVRDHTMTSQGWQSVRLKGREIGEIGLDALMFGLEGVPVLFVSGDDKACAEAEQELKGVPVYATKSATCRHAVILKPPARSRGELKDAVRMSLINLAGRKPFVLPGPYELTIRFLHTDQADAVCSRRIDGLTVSYWSDDLRDLLAMAM